MELVQRGQASSSTLSILNNLLSIVGCSEDYENIETIQGCNLFKQEIVKVSDAVNLQTVFVKEDDVKIEIKGKSLLIFCIFLKWAMQADHNLEFVIIHY